MRKNGTRLGESRKQKGPSRIGESRGLRGESVEELRARGVMALTKAQVAAALQVTYRTITEMIRRGEISCFRVGKRLVRIRIEEALRVMEARGERAVTCGEVAE